MIAPLNDGKVLNQAGQQLAMMGSTCVGRLAFNTSHKSVRARSASKQVTLFFAGSFTGAKLSSTLVTVWHAT